MLNIIAYIVGGLLAIGGLGLVLFLTFKKDKTVFSNLDHIKVPAEWVALKHAAWDRASEVLKKDGLNPVTKCKSIVVEAGIKVNPNTGQWGRPTMMYGKEYWYAGLGGSIQIRIVATPDLKPYNRSQAILTHEVAETILWQNPQWAHETAEKRNQYLWKLGL